MWIVSCGLSSRNMCMCQRASSLCHVDVTPYPFPLYQLSANWFMLGMNKWQLSYCIQELYKLWSCALCINLNLNAYFILNETLCMELAFFMIYSNVMPLLVRLNVSNSFCTESIPCVWRCRPYALRSVYVHENVCIHWIGFNYEFQLCWVLYHHLSFVHSFAYWIEFKLEMKVYAVYFILILKQLRWKTNSEILKLNSRSKVTAREMWSTFTQFGRELKLFITSNESTSNVNWMNHKFTRCVAVVIVWWCSARPEIRRLCNVLMFGGIHTFIRVTVHSLMRSCGMRCIRGSFIFVMSRSKAPS